MHGPLTLALTFLSSSVFPAVVMGLRAITLALISNSIGLLVAGLVTGAALVISNWEKVRSFFTSFWEYIKSIIKPIGEAFAWIGNTVVSPLKNTIGSAYGKIFENSPIKEFKKRGSLLNENDISKNSALKSINSPLNNSVLKEFSQNKDFKINSVIEQERSSESKSENNADKILKEYINNKFENKEQKTFNQTQNFSISVQAAPGQDTRSLADEVIKRIREQARSALFDIVEEVVRVLRYFFTFLLIWLKTTAFNC